jgi:hypothetical protein
MSKNTEASEAINETYKYCSGKIFHLREYVNFNFSFFQALVAPKSGTYVSFTLPRHAKTRTFRFLANYAPNFGAYIISARQRSLAQHTNFPVWRRGKKATHKFEQYLQHKYSNMKR